jgi:hypothetical protein
MATAPYMTVESYRAQALVPGTFIDEVESVEPGWTLARLVRHSAWINAKLAKRYPVPFGAPYPEAVLGWLDSLTTLDLLLRRGVDPTDQQFDEIKQSAERARSDVAEAANSETGLFDLPLRADTAASGLTKGLPLVYSEASPYAWADVQRERATDEDANGEGTLV